MSVVTDNSNEFDTLNEKKYKQNQREGRKREWRMEYACDAMNTSASSSLAPYQCERPSVCEQWTHCLWSGTATSDSKHYVKPGIAVFVFVRS